MSRHTNSEPGVQPGRGLWLSRQLAAACVLGCLLTLPARADEQAFPSSEVRAWQTGWAHPDRIQHATLSFSTGLAVGLASRRPAAGVGAALTIGLLKELVDARRRRFDWGDLAADAVGAGAALALNRMVDP